MRGTTCFSVAITIYDPGALWDIFGKLDGTSTAPQNKHIFYPYFNTCISHISRMWEVDSDWSKAPCDSTVYLIGYGYESHVALWTNPQNLLLTKVALSYEQKGHLPPAPREPGAPWEIKEPYKGGGNIYLFWNESKTIRNLCLVFCDD